MSGSKVDVAAEMKRSPEGKPRTPEIWFDRDWKISDALKAHRSWTRATIASFKAQLAKVDEAMSLVTLQAHDGVRDEQALLANRAHALQLVLGRHRDEPDEADSLQVLRLEYIYMGRGVYPAPC